jgi:hypothetical protein
VAGRAAVFRRAGLTFLGFGVAMQYLRYVDCTVMRTAVRVYIANPRPPMALKYYSGHESQCVVAGRDIRNVCMRRAMCGVLHARLRIADAAKTGICRSPQVHCWSARE